MRERWMEEEEDKREAVAEGANNASRRGHVPACLLARRKQGQLQPRFERANAQEE